ncbi:hypothetical protein EST38_g6415 [Candolleomyces aberdarensis]|uniref:DUF4219 domain-containing protein n=1 Tax=Candolleomyces aberdarensis TaxID=2316362 RepID=A0A4Q2DHN6_9AGAR|nr:hypothetical protein EST38_g6415 [Candolleomyces aberdarensis]
MSSNSANNLAIVPVFDGSNYAKWSSAMRSFLQYQSLWQVVSGAWEFADVLEDIPAVTADTETGRAAQRKVKYSPEAKRLNAEDRRKWLADNDSAIGALKIRIKDSLHIHVVDESAAESWAALKEKYGTTTSSQKFSWFMQLMRFQLPGTSSPHKELGPFDDLVSKLSKADIDFSEEVLSMLIIMKLPDFYRNIMPLLVRDINANNLKLEDTKGYLVTEWERKQRPASKPIANRISAVKHKKGSPQFHSQQKGRFPSAPPQQRAEFVPQQQQKGKKQRQRAGRGKGGKSAKAKGKARAHAADVSDSENSDGEFDEDDRLFAASALADQASQGLAASMARLEEVPDQAGPSSGPSSDPSSSSSSSSTDSPYRGNPFHFGSMNILEKATNVTIGKMESHRVPSTSTTEPPLVPRTNGRMTARGKRPARPTDTPFGPAPSFPAGFIDAINEGTKTPVHVRTNPKDGSVGFSITNGKWGNKPFPGLVIGKTPQGGPSLTTVPQHIPNRHSKYNPPPTRPSRPLPIPPPAPRRQATVTLITGNGAISRVEQEMPVQKKPTPPSIYSAVESSRRTASRLGVRKTTETMKKLEMDSGVHQDPDVLQRDSDLEMAPARSPSPMTEIMEVTDDEFESDELVSIGSQPNSRKRSRSSSPDNEAPPTSEFNIDDCHDYTHVAQSITAERFKPRPFLDDFEEEELERELVARKKLGCIDGPILDELDGDGLKKMPKRWVASINNETKEWSFNPWLDWIAIPHSLAEFRKSPHHKGNALRVFPSGTTDVVPQQDFAPGLDFIIPSEYCLVESSAGFEIHYGDKPRYPCRKGYHWLWIADKSKWVEAWTVWNKEGSMDSEEIFRHRENCSECLDGSGCGQC